MDKTDFMRLHESRKVNRAQVDVHEKLRKAISPLWALDTALEDLGGINRSDEENELLWANKSVITMIVKKLGYND